MMLSYCLAFFWNAAFSFLYSSYFPLLRISFRSCEIFKASPDSHLETFFLLTFGTFLYAVSFNIFRISSQSSSGSLYFIVSSLNLFFLYLHRYQVRFFQHRILEFALIVVLFVRFDLDVCF